MKISRLFIYPVKSCSGIEVESLSFDQNGPVGDRRFVIASPSGDFITQREVPAMAYIQPRFEADKLVLGYPERGEMQVSTTSSAEPQRVRIWSDEVTGVNCGDDVAVWLSDILEQPARLFMLPDNNPRRADNKYAPDDTAVGYADGFPLLVVTQESLDALTEAAQVPVDVRRFRPNIVIEGADIAFAERDWTRLTTNLGEVLPLVKPCERCVIPTRDPDTLERSPEVMSALKEWCRIEGRIIFGQNAIFTGKRLGVGEALYAESE
ncbi:MULTISPECIES: MOSC domain-containing protein [Thalassolituus]|uniref:MOSC domain-containing protein n=1 Tax=Thalassolituus TaxID=187492 RepID=UPI000C4A7FFF|nr:MULTISPECIES: MOSC N-terminal beta barrel domain-containing protein [Thalassolituus]MAX85971.1 MOSC domain-containing protein [Oceanospirillaceae bacterium]MEC9255729.1 MOSC N-terminal beta barrel domain-containing protein [Pseudomonadota bacterium]HCG80222.1 MOSC domain-containing protein [Oceanospirillales bacterium]|tara:strand:- start:14787 stop:15581 length:795 start_codon:yes stop_codon:yes gene_type:complete